jgi:hypothetical protein
LSREVLLQKKGYFEDIVGVLRMDSEDRKSVKMVSLGIVLMDYSGGYETDKFG